ATMWGQYAGTLIAERMAALAEAPRAGSEAVPKARFDPGATRRFALRGARAKRVLRDLEAKLAAQLGVELEAVPRLRFETAAPNWSAPIWPTVRVEVADEDGHWAPFVRDGARVDERGPEFVTFPNAI